jgi:hypothetical protein
MDGLICGMNQLANSVCSHMDLVTVYYLFDSLTR